MNQTTDDDEASLAEKDITQINKMIAPSTKTFSNLQLSLLNERK